MTQNQLAYWELQRKKLADAETMRSNKARELENERHNAAMESAELQRLGLTKEANVETERAHRAQEELNALNLTETARSHKASEALQSASIAETKRSNIAGEKARWAELSERQRSNQASEAARWSELAERQRSNLASEQEIKRHNLMTEKNTLASINLERERFGWGKNMDEKNLEWRKEIETAKLEWDKTKNAISNSPGVIKDLIAYNRLLSEYGDEIEANWNQVTQAVDSAFDKYINDYAEGEFVDYLADSWVEAYGPAPDWLMSIAEFFGW